MQIFTEYSQVVVTQPTPVTRVNYGEKPNNYLAASIINLLCCFFLLGVIALVFSLQVSRCYPVYIAENICMVQTFCSFFFFFFFLDRAAAPIIKLQKCKI